MSEHIFVPRLQSFHSNLPLVANISDFKVSVSNDELHSGSVKADTRERDQSVLALLHLAQQPVRLAVPTVVCSHPDMIEW